jgi:hypothetical protein
MRARAWSVAVVLLAATGIVERIVVLTGRYGAVDSDEAVVGLMARAFRDGHWRAFYWGQHYGGSQEAALIALAGASTAALKLVPVVLGAVAALLAWRVGRRMVDEQVAQAGALLFWVAPGSYVWGSTKARGLYSVTLVLGLLLVLTAQRVVERDGRPFDWSLLGLAAGSGFWASPNILYFAVPTALWILFRRASLRWSCVAVPTALVGALPWLWHNVGHGWPSLDRPPQPEHIGYVAGVGRLLWRTWPLELGLRWPVDEGWTLGLAGPVVLVVLGAALVVAAVRRPSRPVLLLAILAIFPLIYAWFPGAWFVGEGRYAVFAVPFLSLAVAWLVDRRSALAVLAVPVVLIAFLSLGHLPAEPPEHTGGDLAALRAAEVDHAWADYWVAYRLGFESGGDVVVSSHVSSREASVHDAVLADPTPAFLYFRGDPRAEQLRKALLVPHRTVLTPHFEVILATGVVDVTSLEPGVVP